MLTELVGDTAVERAEALELVRIVREGGALRVQYTHPLFGEVIRRRLGSLTARRLRGKLVSVLQAQGSRTAADRILIAVVSAAISREFNALRASPSESLAR